MRLQIASKVEEGREGTGTAVVRGLLHDGKRTEPFLLLRASDPATMTAAAQYLTGCRMAGHSQGVLEQARAAVNAIGAWQRDNGVFARQEADAFVDWANLSPVAPAARKTPAKAPAKKKTVKKKTVKKK